MIESGLNINPCGSNPTLKPWVIELMFRFLSKFPLFSAISANLMNCKDIILHLNVLFSLCALGDCWAGFYCDWGSSRADEALCPAGFFCPSGTPVPMPCPAGTFSSETGNTHQNNCTTCTPGYYCQGRKHCPRVVLHKKSKSIFLTFSILWGV